MKSKLIIPFFLMFAAKSFAQNPTTNIYNFILLDQVNGRTWQVQWGKEKERMVILIK